METANVIVLPYDCAWERAFEEIKGELEAALGNLICGIEHVGSTAVPGMCAKPCIDLDVIISDYTVFEAVCARLAEIGYYHEGDLGIKEREAFGYADKRHLYKHHLYVCPKASGELHRHLTFRDYLRSHPDDAKWYSEVKLAAALHHPGDIDGYMQEKAPCIAALYRKCHLIE